MCKMRSSSQCPSNDYVGYMIQKGKVIKANAMRTKNTHPRKRQSERLTDVGQVGQISQNKSKSATSRPARNRRGVTKHKIQQEDVSQNLLKYMASKGGRSREQHPKGDDAGSRLKAYMAAKAPAPQTDDRSANLKNYMAARSSADVKQATGVQLPRQTAASQQSDVVRNVTRQRKGAPKRRSTISPATSPRTRSTSVKSSPSAANPSRASRRTSTAAALPGSMERHGRVRKRTS